MKYKLITIPTFLVLLLAIYIFPWRKIDWGTLRMGPERSITVTGTATSQELNQVARFSAGVNATNDDQAVAISEVENTMTVLIEAIKEFGIPDSDIKTESISVYQREDSDIQGNSGQQGAWRVSNSLSVTLRDTSSAALFTKLLTNNGATNIFGPNFGLEDTEAAESTLLQSAIDKGREKALVIAKHQGVELDELISVVEGHQDVGVFSRMEAIGGAGPLEPGSTTLSKTVTVTFRVKP